MIEFKFSGVIENHEETNVWSTFVYVPLEISDALRKDHGTRVVALFNDSISVQCALLSNGSGEYFVLINAQLRKKLSVKVHDKVEVTLSPDSSEYGTFMPEEFSELLAMDEEGSAIFHGLTPGKQRTLIHLVAKNKLSDTKIKKALVILDYLKKAHGNLDYKELNEAFKNANRK